MIYLFICFLPIALLYLSLKYFDTSELNNVDNTVMACYGHTSFIDGFLSIYIAKKLNGKVLVKDTQVSKVPWFLRDRIIIVSTKKSNQDGFMQKNNNNVYFAIEGSRSYKDYIHSGFYHYAKKHNKRIVFVVIDFFKWRLNTSCILDPNEIKIEETLIYLENLLKVSGRYAVYPKCCNKIKLKTE